MPVSLSHRLRRTFALLALFGCAGALAGCASVGDTISPAFADPGKYELWDCKQLEAERKSLAIRTADLQKLMDKAETGAGGPVVAEMVYRNDYVALRGQAHFADEAWRRGKCHETTPATTTSSVPPAAATPAMPAARSAPASKSGSAVY